MNKLKEVEGAATVRILVVDDEEIVRDMLSDALSHDGYNVQVAKDGEDAIKQIENAPFEIVITDLKMPGIDGLEVLKYAKKTNPDICILMITAYGTVGSAVTAMKLGAYDYICKPFELCEMKIIIEKAIERQRLLHESRLVESYKFLSITDCLTKIYNCRYFDEFIDREIERVKRSSGVFSLVFVDVDNFKQYNDVNGHIAGDNILRELAEVLLASTRKTDFAVRHGGEEFVLVLPDTTIEGALHLASSTAQVIQSKKWRYVSALPKKRITVSMGVVTFPRDALIKEVLIKKADEAMYYSKNNGKDKICYFKEGNIVEYEEAAIHQPKQTETE